MIMILFFPHLLMEQFLKNYSLNEKHYAIDAAVTKNTPVKATADGVVVFSEWTSETGYVLLLLIKMNYFLFKHNSSLTKIQGDM